MVRQEQSLEVADMGENLALLAANDYTGRGIILGAGVQVYWVMGRSGGSRNRILEVLNDTSARTRPYDESGQTGDPKLTQYRAMASASTDESGLLHVVSNGWQTDNIVDGLETGDVGIYESLLLNMYEPDAPNYTPRISGISSENYMWFGITSKDPVSDNVDHRLFVRDYESLGAGAGLCVHTYEGDAPAGEALPSFTGNPYPVPVFESADETADLIWDHLNADNRVALAVKTIGNLGQSSIVARNALLGD